MTENEELIISATAVEIQESPRVSLIASASPLVEVVAPATLAEGYTFRAQLRRRLFDVTVPPGGVEEGQRFLVPWPDSNSSTVTLPISNVPSRVGRCSNSSTVTVPISNVQNRVGRWKDGLCRCCKHGACHAMLCNAYFCPLVGISQVMTRLDLSWLGTHGSGKKTFRNAVIITCSVILMSMIDTFLHPVPYVTIGATVFFFMYLLYATIITRKFIRAKSSIPSCCCGECEDFCCAIFCNFCVIAQMARHTTDYDTYSGYCCTKTGLPSSAPGMDEETMEPLL